MLINLITTNRGKKRKEEKYLAVWKIPKPAQKNKQNQTEEEELFKYNSKILTSNLKTFNVPTFSSS